MEFFKQNTSIDFMGQRMHAMYFSIAIFIVSMISVMTYGLNLGLDFTGGTQIEIHYPHSVNFCLLYTSPSPRDRQKSRMPSSA